MNADGNVSEPNEEKIDGCHDDASDDCLDYNKDHDDGKEDRDDDDNDHVVVRMSVIMVNEYTI